MRLRKIDAHVVVLCTCVVILICVSSSLSSGAELPPFPDTLIGPAGQEGVALSDEKRLIKHLLEHYQKVGVVGRPVYNTSETIKVLYGVALIQILDLNERDQVLTTNCWSRYQWHDILLAWDPQDFGGVDHVRVPTDKIWTPDICLYNYADDRLKEHREAFAVVASDGTVLWVPQAIFKSSCVIDITHFPFDHQDCFLKFGSWTYDGFSLDLGFFDDNEEFDLNDYIPSNEWEVLANPAIKNTKYYPCCIEPYPDLTFHISLKRKVAFYNYILILPCVLLSSLTLVLFWLPPESPAKMVLGMNIFVAFFVLLLLLAESTPPAASSIPLIGAYYCLNMVLITLSTFLSVIVINLYFRGDKKNTVPRWLKRTFIDCLARALCMRKALIPEGYDKPSYHTASASSNAPTTSCTAGLMKSNSTNSDNHTTHHVTHTHYTQGKDGKHHRKKIKCPQMKYNKFQMYDLKDTPPAMTQGRPMATGGASASSAPSSSKDSGAPTIPSYQGNHIGGASALEGATSPDKSPIHLSQSVEQDVKEIRRYLRTLIGRIHQKEDRAKITLEWRIVALVLDRIFFYFYLTAMIVSLATIFPKTTLRL